MARYFFHLDDSASTTDLDGAELSDIEAAKCHAVQLIAETLCHAPHKFWSAETYRITVTDESGLGLFVVQMVATLSPALSA